MDQREAVSESADSLGDTIAPRAAQLEEIVGSGNSDEKAAAIAQNPPEFRRIHAPRDR